MKLKLCMTVFITSVDASVCMCKYTHGNNPKTISRTNKCKTMLHCHSKCKLLTKEKVLTHGTDNL